MNVCKGLDARSWKDLYQAAIFESDSNKLPERIADAEAALVISARELFYAADDDGQEAEDLDDAMYILRALRNSLKRSPTAMQRTSELGRLKSA
jgi:hypothetical protein